MRKRVLLGLGLPLVAAVVVTYLPALRAGFIWNDDTYLTENPTLDGAAGLHAIWTNTTRKKEG